ncbi:hypothetical protein HAHE_16250 [Haloferula helveola]|uniref:Lipoprotein n=1 Tax=Haloferula helveola TaxID=490095 RepID=A0ABM7RJE8_9BACT|nr:hypothetical protein HAHE_16250 [Haloferula helveola]
MKPERIRIGSFVGAVFFRPVRLLILFSCGLLSCCADRPVRLPAFVEGSAPEEFDSRRATFEEHIHLLSPFKESVLRSEAYQERLRAGYQHPNTRSRRGEDYVFIPGPVAGEEGDFFEHSYQLDREAGEFTTVTRLSERSRMTSRCARRADGWWRESVEVDPPPLGSIVPVDAAR